MTGSAAVRRACSGALVGAVLSAGALTALPQGGVLQAVVSFTGSLPQRTGVSVVGELPVLHMAVVRGRAADLAALATDPSVRGLDLDAPARLTGAKDDDGPGGVLASTGLGGSAGRPGAGAGAHVALVDTGVSDTPALNRTSGRLVDAVDASTPGTLSTGGVYTDGYGHGTFMASVLAGGPVKGTGGAPLGVAPGATVLNVRVANADGSTSLSRVLGGLEWIAQHPALVDVANLALSYDRPQRAYGADPLTDAVDKVRDAGVTVVVASGNDRQQLGDPGFDPRALTAGALDVTTGKVAGFSGSDAVYGYEKPDVVANGVKVLGLLPTGSVIEQQRSTKHLANGLFRGSGTSQATAVTSGLAALVVAAHPDATPVQVKASLRCAATDLPGHRDGAGRVSATTTLCAGADGQKLDGSGDGTGEAGFDANAWAANAWAANAWAANAWAANAWAANAWAANAWAGGDWDGSSS